VKDGGSSESIDSNDRESRTNLHIGEVMAGGQGRMYQSYRMHAKRSQASDQLEMENGERRSGRRR
jgi:hypothetical protein